MERNRIESVPVEIIKETNCPYGFRCLEGELCSCEVLAAGSSNRLFLKSGSERSCRFASRSGYAWVCCCPTHYCLHETAACYERSAGE